MELWNLVGTYQIIDILKHVGGIVMKNSDFILESTLQVAQS